MKVQLAKSSSTGNSYLGPSVIPFTLEVEASQTSAVTIAVSESAPAADANTTVLH